MEGALVLAVGLIPNAEELVHETIDAQTNTKDRESTLKRKPSEYTNSSKVYQAASGVQSQVEVVKSFWRASERQQRHTSHVVVTPRFELFEFVLELLIELPLDVTS